MKPLTLTDRENMILILQDEIRRNDEARYDHRLHGVLLVAQGLTCPQVARQLGDSVRMVQYWVNRFERQGLAGLLEGERSGRPGRLSARALVQVGQALRKSPAAYGLAAQLWDGPVLAEFLRRHLGVELKVRQCQRLFRRLGFRLRKPRPQIASANPQQQAAHKKTPPPGRQSPD
jgi:transposase